MKWFKRHEQPSVSESSSKVDYQIEQKEAYLRSYVNRAEIVLDEIGIIGQQIEALGKPAKPKAAKEESFEVVVQPLREMHFLYFCSYRLLDELSSLTSLIRVNLVFLEGHYNKFPEPKKLAWLNAFRIFTTEVDSQIVYVRTSLEIVITDNSTEQMEANIKSWHSKPFKKSPEDMLKSSQ